MMYYVSPQELEVFVSESLFIPPNQWVKGHFVRYFNIANKLAGYSGNLRVSGDQSSKAHPIMYAIHR